MTVRVSRRLPGFRFEVQPPPPTDALPRMDVAVFVGFAASGPLHTPVAVEDIAQFTAIFGGDIPLAWDRQRSELIYAYLAPAARSFFQNGGQRCWIVRVASKKARYNYFPMSALACAAPDSSMRPAFARARSEGSWSDALSVSTSLFSRLIYITDLSRDAGKFVLNVATASANDIIAGDLLRLTFSPEGYQLLLAVESIELQKLTRTALASSRSTQRVTCGKAFWFKLPSTNGVPSDALRAVMFTRDAEKPPVAIKQFIVDQNQTITLNLEIAFADAPTPGELLRIDGAPDQLWMTVQAASLVAATPRTLVQVRGEGLWLLQEPLATLPDSQPLVEKLTFTAWTRQNDEDSQQLIDLAFTQQHPRFWQALPTDAQLYQGGATTTDATQAPVLPSLTNTPYAPLWSAVIDPRFPLAGDDASDMVYLPIGMAGGPDYFLQHDKGLAGHLDLALVRDGLDSFGAHLFLDWDMIEATTQEVIAQANFLRYQSDPPHALEGIYAALDIEEASMIAVPDALHRGWSQADYDDISSPEEDTSATDIQPGKFQLCPSLLLAPPTLLLKEEPDIHGTFTLTWSLANNAHASYRLQEAVSADWSDAITLYEGNGGQCMIYGRSAGDYYYRVHTEIADGEQEVVYSHWSKGLVVRTQPARRWEMLSEDAYNANDLLAIHRALARVCAARGDMFALLALPAHYTEDAAMAHIETLKAPLGLTIQLSTSSIIATGLSLAPDSFRDEYTHIVLPLGYDERSAFSFCALYHPWLVCYEGQAGSALRHIPPDAASAGIMARRTLARGVWIAPANEQLNGVVALTPHIEEAYWQRLQNAQINIIRRMPRGYIALSADTLSDEEDIDLRPINVRRLLMLLRRQALRLGATFVFEANGAAFQRLVQRSFEGMLEDMFVRGAFAGATPESSFRVVTSALVDQGQFIVELWVAPALPLTFLVMRLVQSGTAGSVMEVL